jgi:hypothetical protein
MESRATPFVRIDGCWMYLFPAACSWSGNSALLRITYPKLATGEVLNALSGAPEPIQIIGPLLYVELRLREW